jgi:predicted protein tyrosine phosphatase
VSFDVFVSALAQGRLEADVARIEPTHVLSLLDPERDAPSVSVRHGVVRFRDTLVEGVYGSFGEKELREVLGFIEEAIAASRVEAVRLIVHCHHGQSRSPAAAFIALALALGPGREHEAFKYVVARSENPWPNRLVIELADKALGRGGALLRELDAFHA